ncbi:FtsX-like permease family protein [Georgenia yuyongxinii]|uniref:FtsX-like permease family protein n=1 Tax=Georgenia yuyongxinii TaxID=2589797 RepID=A0A5B8C493_9MICO|nr:FtsX-like permease family protein [Georgenia yuyongxinii]QDC25383.1 FtsX-like permease family protein [Georgenia yuyongxinii]
MLRLTLAQMRRSAGRLAAAGLAIAVGTAFVAATLLAGALVRDTTYRTVTASLGDADVVLYPADRVLDPAAVTRIGELDTVEAADGVAHLYGQVRAGGRLDAADLTPVASAASLDTHRYLDGAAPARSGELALTGASAKRLGVGVGDTVRAEWELWEPATVAAQDGAAEPSGDSFGEGTWVTSGADLTVTGVLVDPPSLSGAASTALVTRADVEGWLTQMDPSGGPLTYDSVLVDVADGADPAAVAEEISDAVPSTVVRTALQEAEHQTEQLTGDTQTLTYLVLGFAAIAMFVAGLVIANTFQVLVAQRTHALALLRCVGATKAQVHRSVLLEAVLLGVVGGVVGLLAGLALGQGALWFVGRADIGVDVATTITVTPAVLAVPVLTGAVVTVLAALAPARAATRVRPVAALRPASAPGNVRGGGRLRFWLAALLITGGTVLLGGAVALAVTGVAGSEYSLGIVLAVGVLGGIVSFAGVMVGAVFLVPGAVRVLGRALGAAAGGQRRPTVALATVNATRNPRRTSATASALLIGVALVTLMATGAAGARASLGATLDAQFPVDLAAEVSSGGAEGALTPAQVDAIASTEGVELAVTVPTAQVELARADHVTSAELTVLDPSDLAAVVRAPRVWAGLTDDVLLVGDDLADALDATDGDEVTITAGTSAEATDGAAVTVVVVPEAGWLAVATPATAPAAAQPAVTQVWARLSGDDPAGTVQAVRGALAEATTSAGAVPFVTGAAAEREAYEQVIDTLLSIVIGLLGVAVVIALIGVANTLSLSVIERRREHALLRATGMTRGQLRALLAVEGVLIAVVGAAVGGLLGLVYGWAGTAVILGGTGELVLAVPWDALVAVALVAILAGLVASVLPARSAVRTPPVAALAAE